jgi:cell fate (sporulation/competence/biofilm development) regulator YlbF (YheA/YmcA/DUF963 family)
METIALVPPALYAAAQALAGALERSEPVAALRAAEARLDADEDARALIEELDNAGADLRRRQSQQALTREDIERFRALQERARLNPVIAAWIRARDEAAAYLPQVNMRISELTGWDFAAMAAPPGTC